MSKNLEELPFTEIVERASEIARERADVESKVRAIVNDVYIREIARKEDWTFFLVSSSITLVPQYITGNITATTGSNTVTFSSDVVLTASNNGMQLKISGNDYVYQFTFGNTTGGTITPPLSGNVNVTSQPYALFQAYYSLANNFDRFPKNGGLVNYRGTTEEIITEQPYQEWWQDYSSSAQDTPKKCRIIGQDTMGNALLEINPPAKSYKTLRYDYFYKPRIMRENTAGLCAVSASATTVFGDPSTQFALANTGDYFRIDAFGTKGDSEWYRIGAINGTALTLQTAFGLSGATSAGFTICSAPQMPYKMHPAILYGTVLQLTVDQEDPMFQAYNLKLAEVLSDGKRLYKTRIYNQDIHHLGEEFLYRR